MDTPIDQSPAGLVRLCVERHSPNRGKGNLMLSMNDLGAPPMPTGAEFAALDALASIATLLGDPAATKARIAEFVAAAVTARQVSERAAKDRAETDRHRT